MASPDLALSWKDHHGVLFSVFEKLLEKKSLVDCTLAAEGKFLKAHRIVLSACSPYFEALLNQEHDKHPIVFLRDVRFDDLKTLLEFIYSGEIKIPENRLVEFLNVAEALQIKGLGGVGNEGTGRKTPDESKKPKEPSSPIPRKRSRRHSNSSEGNSRDRADIIPVTVEKSKSQQSSEKLPSAAVPSVPSSSRKPPVDVEELSVDVSKVKQEVINPPQSSSEHLASDHEGDPNEEILGLKPEFEQVTFTEDYSNDMLAEDSGSAEPVLDQDQPSSSHQFGGFAAEPVAPGELSMHAPYAVGSAEQPVPEGFAVDPLRAAQFTSWLSEQCKSVSSYTRKVIADGGSFDAREEAITQGSAPRKIYSCHERSDLLSCDVQMRVGYQDIVDGNEFEEISNAIVGNRTSADNHKGFECTECKKVFSYARGLRRHKSVHSDEKPFACKFCPLTFRQAGNLKIHLVVHTGERPFQCKYCPKKFTQSNTLQYHMRAQHTGERPYKCEFCGRSFIRSTGLREHTTKHHSLT